jgi:hypothetical protein
LGGCQTFPFLKGKKEKEREKMNMKNRIKKVVLLGNILRNNTSTFWCRVTPLDPHLVYT